MSGYLTQKVPPKPQQTSSFISRFDTPSTIGEQLARLRLDAEFAQARAGVVIGGLAVECRVRPLSPSARRRGSSTSSKVLAAKRLRAPDAPAGVAGEEFGIVLHHHAAAGARRQRRHNRNPQKASMTCARVRAPCLRSPELKAGWPQQVCASGTSTVQPASSSSFAAAKPTLGRIRSTRQVTNEPGARQPPPRCVVYFNTISVNG
jgi:hypothetical protein